MGLSPRGVLHTVTFLYLSFLEIYYIHKKSKSMQFGNSRRDFPKEKIWQYNVTLNKSRQLYIAFRLRIHLFDSVGTQHCHDTDKMYSTLKQKHYVIFECCIFFNKKISMLFYGKYTTTFLR